MFFFANLPVREGPRTVIISLDSLDGQSVSGAAIFACISDHLAISPSSLVVSLSGRPLRPEETYPTSAIDNSRLDVYPRLCGGGGDGGSTGAESRSCYLEMYRGAKQEKVDPREEALARFTRCRLSNETLAEPCVCDELGNLYNKEAVLTALLTKAVPKALFHLSMKTITDLKLTRNDTPAPELDQEGHQAHAPFACPVTGVPMNGRFRFLVHPPTGHVISDKALRSAPKVVEELLGGGKVNAGDLLPLNPQGEELEGLRLKVAQRVAQAEAKKKAKKGGVAKEGEGAEGPVVGEKRKASEDGEEAGAGAGKKEKKGEGIPQKPTNATDKVWNSLFLDKSKKEDLINDFFVRGAGSRGQRIGGGS